MKEKKIEQNNMSNLMSRIPAEKKKLILALGLITVMVLLWVRAFSGGGDGPAVAKAGDDNSGVISGANSGKPEMGISYIKLPVVPGRNDVLTRDIFTHKNLNVDDKSESEGYEKTDIQSDYILQIAQTIKLDAIILAEPRDESQVLLDGKLLSVGSRLSVTYDESVYEFTIKQVYDNRVVLKCNEISVVVKMSSMEKKKIR